MQNLPARTHAVNTPESDARRLDRLGERETVIQYDDAGPVSQVFTCQRGLAAALLRRDLKPTRENRRGGRIESWTFEVPKSWISVRPPRRCGMTSEHRRAAAERLALHKNPDRWSGIPEGKAADRG